MSSAAVLDSNPCADAMLRLLQAMGLSAVPVTAEVVALTTTPICSAEPAPESKPLGTLRTP